MRRDGRPPRVLIVEDEVLIALNLREMLEGIGVAEVDCARDLDAAAEFIRVTPPDFAILDVNIGRALVFPIADDLQSRAIPFVFSSSQGWRDLPPQFSSHPFAAKPLGLEALTSILSSIGLTGGAAPQQTPN